MTSLMIITGGLGLMLFGAFPPARYAQSLAPQPTVASTATRNDAMRVLKAKDSAIGFWSIAWSPDSKTLAAATTMFGKGIILLELSRNTLAPVLAEKYICSIHA